MIIKGQLKDAQLELKDNEDPTKTGQQIFDIDSSRVKVFDGTDTKSLAHTDDTVKVDELVNDDGTTAIGSGLPGQALKRKLDDTGWEFGEVAANVDFVKDQFTGDGVETDFTLTRDPGNADNVDVFLQGRYQESDTYTITGTTLSFDTAPQNGYTIEVKSGATGTIAEPADDTVTTPKIANSAVTTAKINDGDVTLAKLETAVQDRLLSSQTGRIFTGGFNGDIILSSSSQQQLNLSGTDTTHVNLGSPVANKLDVQTDGLFTVEASVKVSSINSTTTSLNANFRLLVNGTVEDITEYDLGVFGSGNLSVAAIPTLRVSKTMELSSGDEITFEYGQQNANNTVSVQVIPGSSKLTVTRIGS